jgi:acyl-coenzyme A thioesterase PaaI-like protein
MTSPWPEPGWIAVEPFPSAEAGRAFTGERQRQFLSLRYFKRPDGSLAAVASFGPLSEGAPGRAHGGAILTALDEALGAAAWHAGHRVLTARLSTDFRLSVPLGAELLVETRLLGRRHRAVDLEGRLVDAEGRVYANAEGRFIEPPADAAKRLSRE